MKKWAVVNRLMSMEEAMKLWPDNPIRTPDDRGYMGWCGKKHVMYKSRLVFCTRDKHHTGPHADYHVPAQPDLPKYLLWDEDEVDGSIKPEQS